MGAFFMVIILGTIWLIAKGRDNYVTSQIKTEAQRVINLSECFRENYLVKSDEVEEYRQRVWNHNRDDEEVNELYEEIEQKIGMCPVREMVVAAHFAKKGKVSDVNSAIFSERYIFCYKGEQDEACSGFTPQEFDVVRLAFLRWYDRLLRANGFPYKLMLASEASYRRIMNAKGARWVGEQYVVATDRAAFWIPAKPLTLNVH